MLAPGGWEVRRWSENCSILLWISNRLPFALQQAGTIAIFQLAYRPGLPSMLAVKQFHRNQIPGHVAAKGSGVAIYSSAQASGDGGCPFKTSQPQAGSSLGDIIGGDTRFGVHGGKIVL
jgi:hypothetical protein